MRHSDIVFNLVGRDYPTKCVYSGGFLGSKLLMMLRRNFSYADVHIEGTQRIVEAVAKYDVDRFIHVSSYNANPKSSSEYFATKVDTSSIRVWTHNTNKQV